MGKGKQSGGRQERSMRSASPQPPYADSVRDTLAMTLSVAQFCTSMLQRQQQQQHTVCGQPGVLPLMLQVASAAGDLQHLASQLATQALLPPDGVAAQQHTQQQQPVAPLQLAAPLHAAAPSPGPAGQRAQQQGKTAAPPNSSSSDSDSSGSSSDSGSSSSSSDSSSDSDSSSSDSERGGASAAHTGPPAPLLLPPPPPPRPAAAAAAAGGSKVGAVGQQHECRVCRTVQPASQMAQLSVQYRACKGCLDVALAARASMGKRTQHVLPHCPRINCSATRVVLGAAGLHNAGDGRPHSIDVDVKGGRFTTTYAKRNKKLKKKKTTAAGRQPPPQLQQQQPQSLQPQSQLPPLQRQPQSWQSRQRPQSQLPRPPAAAPAAAAPLAGSGGLDLWAIGGSDQQQQRKRRRTARNEESPAAAAAIAAMCAAAQAGAGGIHCWRPGKKHKKRR